MNRAERRRTERAARKEIPKFPTGWEDALGGNGTFGNSVPVGGSIIGPGATLTNVGDHFDLEVGDLVFIAHGEPKVTELLEVVEALSNDRFIGRPFTTADGKHIIDTEGKRFLVQPVEPFEFNEAESFGRIPADQAEALKKKVLALQHRSDHRSL